MTASPTTLPPPVAILRHTLLLLVGFLLGGSAPCKAKIFSTLTHE